jgi:uncharacterized protein YcfJ
MKLTSVLILGVFTAGSSYALAGHDCDGSHRQHGHGHNKQVGHHKYKSHNYQYSAGRYQRDVSAEYRGGARYGRVIDIQPVYHYYQEPVRGQSCLQYDTSAPNYRSHTATVLGAVIGGALGHRIGDSHGDPNAAAVAGGLLGASVGWDIDRRAQYNRGLRVDGPCRVEQREQSRRTLVEYEITYRYNGQVHTARMNRDPGEWVKLDVNIMPA